MASSDPKTSVWSFVATSLPLNSGPVFKGADKEDSDSTRLEQTFADKGIIFTLADSPVVLPIPLLFLDGSLGYTSIVESSAVSNNGSASQSPFLNSFINQLNSLGIVSDKEEDENLTANKKGTWTIQLFDSKMAARGGGQVSFQPLHIPYMLISIGSTEEGSLATVPLLLKVLSVVLGRVNETIPLFTNGKSDEDESSLLSQDVISISQGHHYHAALVAMARILYMDYSVAIYSMEPLVSKDVVPEHPTAHPLEASDIDLWQPLLMATLFFANTAHTAATQENSASPFVDLTKAEAESFIQSLLFFHTRFAQPIMVYLGDLATVVQAAQTMLLSVDDNEEEETANGSQVNVTAKAASRFLELFPLRLLSGTNGANVQGLANEVSSQKLPIRTIGLCGASYNILFSDDSIDGALEAHCPSSMADEADAESFLLASNNEIPSLFNEATPKVVASVVKRYVRHLIHGLRSDDFCDLELTRANQTYENSANTLDFESFASPMDNAYDNKTGFLTIASVSASPSAFIRALLWELLESTYHVSSKPGAPTGTTATSISLLGVEQNNFMAGQSTSRTSSMGKGAGSAAGSGMSASLSIGGYQSQHGPRSFRHLCQSFTSALRHRSDNWAIENHSTSELGGNAANHQPKARSATSYSAGTHVVGGNNSQRDQPNSLAGSTHVEPIEGTFNRSLSGPPPNVPASATNLSPPSGTVSVGQVVLVPPGVTTSGEFSASDNGIAKSATQKSTTSGAFGAPKIAIHEHLYNFNHTSFASLVGSPVNQFALNINAEEVLYNLCRNAADVLARIGGLSLGAKATHPAADHSQQYTLTPKFAIPSSVVSILLSLYESIPISPSFVVAFPSPSSNGYSPAVAPVAPRAVAGVPITASLAGKNVHEILFESVMFNVSDKEASKADDSIIYLWERTTNQTQNTDTESFSEDSDSISSVAINSYADVCAVHYTLTSLLGSNSEELYNLTDNCKSMFTKICLPYASTAQSNLLICGTSQELPHPLTETSVATQSEDFAAFLLHNVSLHSHVQEGAKNIFLEKCLRSSLAFTKAPNAPRPELLPPVINAAVRISYPSANQEGSEGTTLLTSFENPLMKSRRVRLIHLAFARQLMLPVVGPDTFAEDADALRGGVRGYALADEGEPTNGDSNATDSNPLAFLWKPTVKVSASAAKSTATPIAQQGFMHSQIQQTGSSGLFSAATSQSGGVASSSLKAVSEGLGFGDLFPIVRDYEGPLEVPELHLAVAAAAKHYASPSSSPTSQSPRITATTSMVLSSVTSEAGGGAESAASMPAALSTTPLIALNSSQQREACSCLSQGALGSITAIYALCNAIRIPPVPIITPTAAVQTLAASAPSTTSAEAPNPAEGLNAQHQDFQANFEILLTDVREKLLPVTFVGPQAGALASGRKSPRRTTPSYPLSTASAQPLRPGSGASYDNTTAGVVDKSQPSIASQGGSERTFTVPFNNSNSTDAHLARRLLIKVSYALNHPSVVSYLLTSPETHADRFRELFNTNFFDLADEKKLASEEKENSEGLTRSKPIGDNQDRNDEEPGENEEPSNYNSLQNNFTKKYKTRIEMLYETVLAPAVLYERRLAASGTARQGSNEGGFAMSPWLILWYKFFQSLSMNAERRMLTAENNNTETILSAAAAEIGGHQGSASKQQTTTTIGVPKDVLHAIVEILEEMKTLCPSLERTTTEGFLAHQLAVSQSLATNPTAMDNSMLRQSDLPPSVVGPANTSSSSAPVISAPVVAPPTLEERFAAAQKAFGKVADKHSNDIKLQFYSLFKQATVGDVNISRPWAVDMTGRAKWDAWAKLKGMDKGSAMSQYCDHWEKIAAGSKRI